MNQITSSPHLAVEAVSVTYNNGHTAIKNASFTLHGGTICALVGVNGSGKSTLFKTIMGQVKPQTGQVTLNQQPMMYAIKKNEIAYVPQTEEVDWNFPILVKDVVMMGRYGKMKNFLRIPSTNDKKLVNAAIEAVGLTEYKNRQIGELSGGQKKRVFLARAMAQQGKILLLDEPFTGVDVQTENAIIDLLRRLRDENHLILISTHNLGSVPEFCDQVVLVNKTVIAAGPIKQTFTQQNLEKTFSGMLRHVNLSSSALHKDDDTRTVHIFTDDERAAVFYGSNEQDPPHNTKQ